MAESNTSIVSESLLQDVAKELLEEWKFLGRKLGLSEAEIHNIASDNSGVQERKYQTLLHWKQKQGSQATIHSLASALRHVGRKDLATRIEGGSATPQQAIPQQTNLAKKMTSSHVSIQSNHAKVKGRHNLVLGNTSPGDVALYTDRCRVQFLFLQYRKYRFQYHKRANETITGVLVRDNWDDNTGGFAERTAGGPGQNCIEVEVTSQLCRGMDFSFTVYGRRS